MSCAVSAPKISPIRDSAGRAPSKSSAVHSGFSSSGREVASILSLNLDLSRVGFAEADHVHGFAAIDDDVEPGAMANSSRPAFQR
jgi:hypothetical protein